MQLGTLEVLTLCLPAPFALIQMYGIGEETGAFVNVQFLFIIMFQLIGTKQYITYNRNRNGYEPLLWPTATPPPTQKQHYPFPASPPLGAASDTEPWNSLAIGQTNALCPSLNQNILNVDNVNIYFNASVIVEEDMSQYCVDVDRMLY